MNARNSRLPDDAVLARDVARGLTTTQIASRYNVLSDAVRERLQDLKSKPANRSAVSAQPFSIPRYVVPRRVSGGENGGVTYVNITLPRISMHVDFREHPYVDTK